MEAWVDGGPGLSLLGMSVLARFRVTLDFANDVLYLERRTDPGGQVRLPGWAGVEIRRGRRVFVVEGVENGGPADKARVQVGDHIIEVDGRPLHRDLPRKVAKRIIAGYAATMAEVIVDRRGGHRHRLSFRRESEFATPKRIDLGLLTRSAKAGALAVSFVYKWSAAYWAGLRRGDEVLELNAKAVAPMTQEQLVAEAMAPELALTVRRQGESRKRRVVVRCPLAP